MPSLFNDQFANGPITTARQAMISQLAQFQGSWGQILDQVYLYFRMQSWVGNGIGNLFQHSTPLMPFFDSNFLASALQLPPVAKRQSHIAYELLNNLDAKLATLPLDSGLIPSLCISNSYGAKLLEFKLTVQKALRKLQQRIKPSSAETLGSSTVIDTWHAQEGYKKLDLHSLSSLKIFNEATLDDLGHGRIKMDRSTLGFILLCETWNQQ